MAGSLNKVQLIGNVGRDPEMRYLASGEAVTTFSLATNRRWTGQDGSPREETEWHNVVAWRKLAEQCAEYLAKGRHVYVEGRLQTRSWDDQATRAEAVPHGGRRRPHAAAGLPRRPPGREQPDRRGRRGALEPGGGRRARGGAGGAAPS